LGCILEVIFITSCWLLLIILVILFGNENEGFYFRLVYKAMQRRKIAGFNDIIGVVTYFLFNITSWFYPD